MRGSRLHGYYEQIYVKKVNNCCFLLHRLINGMQTSRLTHWMPELESRYPGDCGGPVLRSFLYTELKCGIGIHG